MSRFSTGFFSDQESGMISPKKKSKRIVSEISLRQLKMTISPDVYHHLPWILLANASDPFLQVKTGNSPRQVSWGQHQCLINLS
jgi:hypothetical protein